MEVQTPVKMEPFWLICLVASQYAIDMDNYPEVLTAAYGLLILVFLNHGSRVDQWTTGCCLQSHDTFLSASSMWTDCEWVKESQRLCYNPNPSIFDKLCDVCIVVATLCCNTDQYKFLFFSEEKEDVTESASSITVRRSRALLLRGTIVQSNTSISLNSLRLFSVC